MVLVFDNRVILLRRHNELLELNNVTIAKTFDRMRKSRWCMYGFRLYAKRHLSKVSTVQKRWESTSSGEVPQRRQQNVTA